MRLQATSSSSALSALQCACDLTDTVGDCVYISGPPVGTNPKVSKCDITNLSKMPAIGVLTQKLSDTLAIVATNGLIDYPDVLIPGRLCWVSETARLTNTLPSPVTVPWYTQNLGEAFTTTTVQLQPCLPIRRLSPTIGEQRAIRFGSDGLLEEFNFREKERWGIPLIGTYNGVNRIFVLPEPAVYNPPELMVRIYHGGRRLNTYEYTVYESIPGLGQFDRVQLTSWAPHTHMQLVADYVAV